MQPAQLFALGFPGLHAFPVRRVVLQLPAQRLCFLVRQPAVHQRMQVVVVRAGTARNWFRYTRCMSVNSQARRSLPGRHSSHLRQARSSVSCTRSSAAQALPVSARA